MDRKSRINLVEKAKILLWMSERRASVSDVIAHFHISKSVAYRIVGDKEQILRQVDSGNKSKRDRESLIIHCQTLYLFL